MVGVMLTEPPMMVGVMLMPDIVIQLDYDTVIMIPSDLKKDEFNKYDCVFNVLLTFPNLVIIILGMLALNF